MRKQLLACVYSKGALKPEQHRSTVAGAFEQHFTKKASLNHTSPL